MAKFKISQLIDFCKQMVGMPYWYGTVVYKCTEDRLVAKAKQYPEHYSSSRMSKYRKAIQKKQVCMDCVGMLKGFFWTNGGVGVVEYINGEVKDFDNKYQANGMPDKSANGLLSWCKSEGCQWGDIDDLPEVPGVLLFRNGHVGIYVGGGKGVEARGFNYGVVETEVAKRDWTTWAYLPESVVEYDTDCTVGSAPAEPEKKDDMIDIILGSRLLRKGDTGKDVVALQELLNAVGFDCGNADGVFGSQTKRELREFQRKYGLEVDGVFGPLSHQKLLAVSVSREFEIRITGGKVNVRNVPNVLTGKVQYVVKKGSKLKAVGRDAATGWYRLTDGNYISCRYVEEV